MPEKPGILFTAFEPSGDHIASALIRELRRRDPDRPIYALGGPDMRDAGAQLIEETTGNAIMLVGAASQAVAHWRRLTRLKRWLAEHPIDALIPTDSPAANWSVCSLVKKHQPNAKVIHLVAPQLWAWAPWRVRKLRRLTDHVLCLLPFEPDWFRSRGVPATFVGHPLYDRICPPKNHEKPSAATDSPTLALLPGSRENEVKRNWPTMLEVYRRLHAMTPRLKAIVAASDTARAHQIEAMSPMGVLPRGMRMTVSDADTVLSQADAALIVSGTATLHAAAHGTPMVVFYNLKPYEWHLAGRWLVTTRTMSLPNLISEWMGLGRIVPEYMPHFGEPDPLIRSLSALLEHGDTRKTQQAGLARIREHFEEHRFDESAGEAVVRCLEGTTSTSTKN